MSTNEEIATQGSAACALGATTRGSSAVTSKEPANARRGIRAS